MDKSIARNSLFNLFYRGFNLVYPVVTSAYISRIFLADGVGEIVFAINIVTYFTLAASLGMPNYAVRVLAPLRNDRKALNNRFTELSLILLISSLIATLLYYIMVVFVFEGKPTSMQMAFALGLMVVTNIFNYDWLFESMEDFRYLAIRSIVIKSLALLLMFLLVKDKSDILVYCLIYAGITVANNIWNSISTHYYAKWVFRHLNIRQHFVPVMTLFAAAFATEVYTLLDSTMLGVMCPSEYLGYYSNASRVVRASFGLVFAAIAVFNPRLNYVYNNRNREEYREMFQRFYNIGMFIAVPTAALLFILAPQVMLLLFGEAFAPGIFTLRLLAGLLVIFTMAAVFGHVGLIIYGRERYLLYAAILGAIVNFSLNQLLIPCYQHNGAAAASLASELLVTLFLLVASMRCCKISLVNARLLVLGVVAITACIGYKLYVG